MCRYVHLKCISDFHLRAYFQVVLMLLNMYKKAISAGRCKKFFESPFGSPPFEPLSITKIVCNFVVVKNEGKRR